MKSVLNFCCTCELCSEVASFQRTEIQVWRLSPDFVNYLPFEVFSGLTTEKPHTLPRIAYRFKLKGGVFLTYANENEEQFEALSREFVGKTTIVKL